MKKTILLFGGVSEERMVSVASAQNLNRHHHFDEQVFIRPDGSLAHVDREELMRHEKAFEREFFPHEKPFAMQLHQAVSFLKDKIVFLALHGTEGEDGVFQRFFEENKIAFTGSGSVSSKNAFEKDRAKFIVAKQAIQFAESVLLSGTSAAENIRSLEQFYEQHKKIVLKPLANGSSIGLHVISDLSSFKTAAESLSAQKYGPYLAEKFIEGRELTVGVFDGGKKLKILPASEVILNSGHSFDYQGKYLGHGTTEVTPANLSAEEMAGAQALAQKAHLALDCYGYSRTDLMLTTKGFVFLETIHYPDFLRHHLCLSSSVLPKSLLQILFALN